MGQSDTAIPGRQAVRTWLGRLRPWLTLAAAGLVLGRLLPPVGIYARQYAFAETLQFVVFAVAAPGLLVLGAPWRLLGLSRRDAPPGLPSRLAPSRWPGLSRPGAVLVTFIAVVIAWRLPAAVNLLRGAPGLTVAEMVTLLAAGAAVWLELVDSPPLPRLSPPAARRDSGGGHVDTLDTRLPHGHVPRRMVQRL